MANVAISSLPTGTATGGEIFVGNQSGTTKALSLGMDAMSDYETGDWTPTLYGTTTAGTTTYTTQTGNYEKIGGLVYVSFVLAWTNLTGTGNARIGGLPFTAASLTGQPRHAFSDSFYTGLSLPNSNLNGYIQEATAYIDLLSSSTTAGAAVDIQTEITTAGEVYGSLLYLA